MNFLAALFWLCFAIVIYTYALYPLWLAVRSRWGRPVRRGPFAGSVSVILAVHNEELNLPRRLGEFVERLSPTSRPWEIIVACDGCTDGSLAAARAWETLGVRAIDLIHNQGKAAALTQACHSARHDILIFADARQTWASDALDRLLENFADAEVGAVSGDLVLETAPGVMAGVGVYWKFEKWLRRKESQIYSQVGVTGAISAVRRDLFQDIPAGTLLDDVYWPLRVAMAGSRVIHDERARAFDRLPEKTHDEFRRKVRTLAGNFQLLGLVPQSLWPGKNPVWFAWISHKLLRLAVPWALLGMLATNAFLEGELSRTFLTAQIACYALALLGLVDAVGRRFKLAGAAASFLVLNSAAWLAFWVWLTGRTGSSWRKVVYRTPEPVAEGVKS